MNPAAIVLYAEDDENDAFFMVRAFTKLKQREALRVVTTGRQAVEYLSGVRGFSDRSLHPLPHLLILDVKMPELSGLEVLRWVRRQATFAALPVVMFTSSTQDSDVAFSREHGANAYLVKPSNAEHLAVLVADLLAAARERRAPEAALRVTGNLI